jgi:hypothetical protein
MTGKTTASWPVDDLEKAKQLFFDPTFYDSILWRARGGGSSEPDRLPYMSVRTMGNCVLMASGVTTEAIPLRQTEQLIHIVKLNATISETCPRYTIKPSFGSERNNTRATRDTDSSLSALINRLRYDPRIRFAERIAARLDYLLEISREEQPEQAPPAMASVEGFLAFLSKNPGLAYPTIVLTPDGNVRAQWRRSPSEHLAIEFLGENDVWFVIFAPDPTDPYKTIRTSGGATVGSVMSLAAPYGVMRWAGEQIQVSQPS